MPMGSRNARSDQGFTARHRFLIVLLWLQVPALAAVGLAVGEPMVEVSTVSLILSALAMMGMVTRGRRLAELAVVLGLLTASAVLVRYADGATLAHFHFLLMIGAISLYREWLTLLAAVLVAIGYHLVLPVEGADPMTTLLIHSGVIVAFAITFGASWRISATVDPVSASSDRFRTSFDMAPIGMAVLRPSGEFLEANAAMERIVGYHSGNLIGMNVTSLVHPDDQADLGAAWEEMGNGTTHSSVGWMRCLTGEGSPIWARVSLSLVPRSTDRPAMVILQLEDVTHTYEEQRRLERLVRGKDDFVATVGGEIREPLEVLIDLTAAESEQALPPGESLPRIGARAREIASILDDLVMSARADSSSISVVAHPVDARAICEEVISAIAGERDISTDFRASEMWADPALVRQIVTGLITNAVRYGGSEISVRTIASGPDTVIQVFDNGPEIPTPERDRVFAGDLRTGQPVTRPAAVGLTLTVGRHLARLMEGDVVYRRTPDNLNLFELRLPSEQISVLPRRRGTMRPSVPA